MTISQLLGEGVNLMFLGMGMVFTFLAVLVFSVGKMSQFVQWIESRRPAPPPPPAQKPTGGADDAVTAAITAAIHRYRTSRR